MPVFLCRHIDKRTEWSFEPGEAATLGFSDGATVPLPDPGLLAREVRITRSQDRYHLRDLAEKDRVLVNGVVTREAVLKHGDRIVVGRIAMLLQDAGPRRGEVDLFRAPDEDEGDPWEVLASEASRVPRPPSPGGIGRRQWRRYSIELCAISLFFGLTLGFLYRVPRPPRQAPGPAVLSPQPAGGTASAASPSGGTGTDQGDTLRKLQEILKISRGEGPATPPPEEAAAPPEPAPSPFTPDRPLDPAASRRLLFKMFLDIAARPPTRAEERDGFPLPHRDRFRIAAEAAAREGRVLPGGAFQEWMGREPTPSEVKDLAGRATPELPDAFWVTAHEEYLARTRARAPGQRAASFLVDLLDRPAASPAELEVILAALAEPGQETQVARALAHSPESRIDASDAFAWELDFFRFILREPLPEERDALSAEMEKVGEPLRRKALLAALASHPAYGRY